MGDASHIAISTGGVECVPACTSYRAAARTTTPIHCRIRSRPAAYGVPYTRMQFRPWRSPRPGSPTPISYIYQYSMTRIWPPRRIARRSNRGPIKYGRARTQQPSPPHRNIMSWDDGSDIPEPPEVFLRDGTGPAAATPDYTALRFPFRIIHGGGPRSHTTQSNSVTAAHTAICHIQKRYRYSRYTAPRPLDRTAACTFRSNPPQHTHRYTAPTVCGPYDPGHDDCGRPGHPHTHIKRPGDAGLHVLAFLAGHDSARIFGGHAGKHGQRNWEEMVTRVRLEKT